MELGEGQPAVSELVTPHVASTLGQTVGAERLNLGTLRTVGHSHLNVWKILYRKNARWRDSGFQGEHPVGRSGFAVQKSRRSNNRRPRRQSNPDNTVRASPFQRTWN